jgi:hypothetical protein
MDNPTASSDLAGTSPAENRPFIIRWQLQNEVDDDEDETPRPNKLTIDKAAYKEGEIIFISVNTQSYSYLEAFIVQQGESDISLDFLFTGVRHMRNEWMVMLLKGASKFELAEYWASGYNGIPQFVNLSSSTIYSDSIAASSLGVSGILPINRGGTGRTSAPSLLTNLASTTVASPLDANPRPGVTGALPIANGGTGATTLQEAKAALGIGDVSWPGGDLVRGDGASFNLYNNSIPYKNSNGNLEFLYIEFT